LVLEVEEEQVLVDLVIMQARVLLEVEQLEVEEVVDVKQVAYVEHQVLEEMDL
jgi:hypothetical protein